MPARLLLLAVPAILTFAPLALAAEPSDDLVRVVAAMVDLQPLEEREGDLHLTKAEDGGTVVQADGKFALRIDLKKQGLDARDFDLIKLEIKADPRAALLVSLENYPRPGQLSHWYLYSKSRDAFGWETAYIDLRRPEEIKEAGNYKGLDEKDPSLRGLRISGFVGETHRQAQPEGRRIWLGPVRLAKKAVDLDWDQTRAPYTWNKGEDLVFRYPLTVTNRLDRPAVALLEMAPMEVEHATAEIPQRVELAAGESQEIEAAVRLPARIAARSAPLYCERFLATAEVEGVADSKTTIVRSSDNVPLTVTVPIADEKLKFPLLARRKDLPVSVTGFDERRRQAALQALAEASAGDLKQSVGDEISTERHVGLYAWGDNPPSQRYADGLTAAAFLYDETGDKKYLKKGADMLLAAADVFPPLQKKFDALEYYQISHGVIAVNTLRLGWATGGMRAPYKFDRHGMFNDFDLLAADMNPKDRQRIIDDFILPAGVHMRNHTFGLGNQQDVVNYAILYSGLAAKNWPLVSFAYSSPYGLKNQLEWDFGDEGLAGEGHYHTPAIRPILYSTELLQRAGVDLYDQRLHTILYSPAADAIGKPFNDSIRDFVNERRFEGKKIVSSADRKDGLHVKSGVTSLRWDGLEVSMNWGKQIHRGAPDRCAFRIDAPERNPLHDIGGGNYSHSSLGQSIIVVNENQQNPQPAEVTGYDIEGPVQFVQATSNKHFSGAAITRTFALLGEHVLAVDRVRCDEPSVVDWRLRYKGGGQDERDVAKGVALPMKHRDGSFTDKQNDSASGVTYGAKLKSDGYHLAVTDQMWRQKNGELTMARGEKTQVMAFAVPAAFSAWKKERETGVPMLMARRENVRETDFLAAFSPHVARVEQHDVKRPDGKPAEAVGLRVTLDDGGAFHAIVNYEAEGVEVRLGDLKTKQRFATDFQP